MYIPASYIRAQPKYLGDLIQNGGCFTFLPKPKRTNFYPVTLTQPSNVTNQTVSGLVVALGLIGTGLNNIVQPAGNICGIAALSSPYFAFSAFLSGANACSIILEFVVYRFCGQSSCQAID